jgi:hypothetical protein
MRDIVECWGVRMTQEPKGNPRMQFVQSAHQIHPSTPNSPLCDALCDVGVFRPKAMLSPECSSWKDWKVLRTRDKSTAMFRLPGTQ